MHKEFTNAQFGSVRTSIINETPCFCLKDICKLLEITNISDCRGRLNEEGIITKEILNGSCLTKMLFITADNLSGCMFQSKKADAEVICDWIYRVVLPKIIHYINCRIDEYQDPDKVVNLLDEFTELKIRNDILETNQKQSEPKLRFLDKLCGTSHCYDLEMIHMVIKYQNIKPTQLLKILRGNHILDDDNVPFQEYCDRKYFRIVEAKSIVGNHTVISQRTYVYQTGITFIEKILKNHEGGKHARNNA